MRDLALGFALGAMATFLTLLWLAERAERRRLVHEGLRMLGERP